MEPRDMKSLMMFPNRPTAAPLKQHCSCWRCAATDCYRLYAGWQFQSVDRPVPVTLPDFSLTDHNGRCEPQRLSRRGRGGVFRLHPMPGRVASPWSSWPRSKLMGADGDKLHGAVFVGGPGAKTPSEDLHEQLDPSFVFLRPATQQPTWPKGLQGVL
jgi:hypothetical protein